tara:strand:- start:57318 stop:57719 length:402 start_codon:yes stop_codon:yes gene_type:complete
MKNQLKVLAIALGIGLMSCNEKKEYGDITKDGTMRVDESTEIDEKMKAGTDSSMRLTDGTTIPVIIYPTDSIKLPNELLSVINKTSDIHPDSILVKRRFVENNITYFELEFKMQEGPNQTFIFDEDGKRKSTD